MLRWWSLNQNIRSRLPINSSHFTMVTFHCYFRNYVETKLGGGFFTSLICRLGRRFWLGVPGMVTKDVLYMVCFGLKLVLLAEPIMEIQEPYS
ncbi:hypothetical protein Ancab_034725 [Ancistrocladus abbreviatus]